MVSTRQETGKGTRSKHCLLFNVLVGCKQGKGGLVGLCVSLACVFIFWNTFKVHILKLQHPPSKAMIDIRLVSSMFPVLDSSNFGSRLIPTKRNRVWDYVWASQITLESRHSTEHQNYLSYRHEILHDGGFGTESP